jgi:hypothetical protein
MSKRRAFEFVLRFVLLLSAEAGISLSNSSLLAVEPVVKKLASGLGSPQSIAIRPEAGAHSEVFIAESAGGQVLRVALDHSDVAEKAITGFPPHSVTKEKSVTWGLQSLYFLDHSRLVVSGGDDKQPFVRLYELSDSAGTLQFDDQKQSIEVAAENRHESENAVVSSFHSIVRPRANDHVNDMLLLATESEKPAMGLWKIPLRANTLEDAVPFPFTKTEDKFHYVQAVAVANSGCVAVAVSTVARNDGSHCMLRFVDPIDGRSRLDVYVDLEGIFEMAYNPVTGDLYAVGLEAPPSLARGLFRLDDAGEVGKPRCRAHRIAAPSTPTALAFSSDGTLFVTSEETQSGGNTDGALYKLSDF